MSMDAAVIDTGGGGGGGILDTVKAHPIMAAAVVGGALGLFVLIRRQSGGSGASNDAAAAPSGGQLSPSANIALGQIASDVTQGFGQASIAAAQNAATTQSNFDAITAYLNQQGAHLNLIGYGVNNVADILQGAPLEFPNGVPADPATNGTPTTAANPNSLSAQNAHLNATVDQAA